MDEKQLSIIANDFLQKNYGFPLAIPIKRNNRLRSTHGRYMMAGKGLPVCIEIAGKTLDYGSEAAIIGILKHECIHYALHRLGKPYHDGDALFEAELKKHQAPRTKTMKIGRYFTFQCDRCHKKYESMRKKLAQTPHQYRTGCCRATLTVTGEVYYHGSETQR